MTNYVLPTCYAAGTVLLIGEQYPELMSLRDKLSPQFFYRLFDEPEQAYQFLQNSYVPHLLKQPWITQSNGQSFISADINIDLHLLATELTSSHRFEEIVSIIIDNTASHFCPMEFCQQFANVAYKKILLIHSHDLKVAKLALAEGIIDGYVVKTKQLSTYVKLTTAICTLAYNYFQQASQLIVKALQDILPYLNDIVFIDFLQTFCADHHIMEFYLIDKRGVYLLLDAQAKPMCLHIATGQVPSAWKNESVGALYGRQTYYYYVDTAAYSWRQKQTNWVSFSTFCTRVAEYL